MTDFLTHLTRTAEHYDKLFKHLGWKDYVQQRTAQMAKECPELYAELAARYRLQQKSFAERQRTGK